jgi:very-short-patch-repair endonuclease
MAITSPARTLLDLAAVLHPRALATASDRARDQRIVRGSELSALVDRYPGRRGTRALRDYWEADREPAAARSRAERGVLRLISRAGLPRPQVNARVANYEVDLYWPEHGLVLEVDGYAFHRHRAEFERDRRREQDLLAAGLRVSRVTWRQLIDDPAGVVARLAAALGHVL